MIWASCLNFFSAVLPIEAEMVSSKLNRAHAGRIRWENRGRTVPNCHVPYSMRRVWTFHTVSQKKKNHTGSRAHVPVLYRADESPTQFQIKVDTVCSAPASSRTLFGSSSSNWKLHTYQRGILSGTAFLVHYWMNLLSPLNLNLNESGLKHIANQASVSLDVQFNLLCQFLCSLHLLPAAKIQATATFICTLFYSYYNETAEHLPFAFLKNGFWPNSLSVQL